MYTRWYLTFGLSLSDSLIHQGALLLRIDYCANSLLLQLFGVNFLELVLAHQLVDHVSLGKLLVLVPEVRLGRLILVLGHLIQDAKVSNDVVRLELIADLEEQLLLGVSHVRILSDVLIRSIILALIVKKLAESSIGEALGRFGFLSLSLLLFNHVIKQELLE